MSMSGTAQQNEGPTHPKPIFRPCPRVSQFGAVRGMRILSQAKGHERCEHVGFTTTAQRRASKAKAEQAAQGCASFASRVSQKIRIAARLRKGRAAQAPPYVLLIGPEARSLAQRGALIKCNLFPPVIKPGPPVRPTQEMVHGSRPKSADGQKMRVQLYIQAASQSDVLP